jgi:hypothetical protein
MAYRERNRGGFRCRASFPITTELIVAGNAICERTGISFAELCQRALRAYVDRENPAGVEIKAWDSSLTELNKSDEGPAGENRSIEGPSAFRRGFHGE